jgi:CRISPR/Cas system-associated exonuclease Cas4 (RecB family)
MPDHFGMDKCLYCPRSMAEVVMAGQDRPAGWSVTMVQGSIREAILKKEIDYRVDPVTHMSMELGTAMHGVLGYKDFPASGRAPRMYGKIHGLSISGEPDLMNDHTIGDYKFTGGLFRIKHADIKHKVQVSLYAELAKQMFGQKIDTGVLYYGGFGQRMLTFKFPIMSVDECLVSSVDRERTLATNFDLARRYEYGDLKVEDIPCGCKDTFFGPVCKAERYCDVSRECRALDGVPF